MDNENENQLEEMKNSQEFGNDYPYKINGPIEKPEATGNRDEILSLLKKGKYLFLGLSSIIFLTAIFIFIFDFDLKGVGIVAPELYVTPSCGKVYLTKEKESYTQAHSKDTNYKIITDPSLIDLESKEGKERFEYEEYSFDEYIAGIVWNDNQIAYDVDNEIVYQAMAIINRTKLIKNFSNNCVVLKEYDELAKRFIKLDETKEKYTEIKEAVTKTQGIVLSREGQLLDVQFDIFSYTQKKKDEDEFKDQYYYHMMNLNEKGEQVIPASWIDKLEKEKNQTLVKKVNNNTKLTSFSLYGAKYLLEKADSQYELYRVLEEYFGRDIEYKTIDFAYSNNFDYNYGGSGGNNGINYNSSCNEISISKTNFSKEEFIAKVNNISDSRAKPLIDNASMIYDMSVANGINPELVYIRATIEGYSPGDAKNNYWGIGCTNTGGYAACYSYSSLAEGVAGYLKILSKYDSVINLMRRYGYIGDYWYNPGSSSLGGCYYMTPIYGNNVPDRVRDACASGRICNKDGSGNCVATTKEEQEAYAHYQIRTMVSTRQKIFGIGADTCESNYPIGEPGKGTCTLWAQSDPRWGNIKLGTSKTTMSKSGCLVTSVAMAVSCSGTTITNAATFNPGSFVQYLNSTGGFAGANYYYTNQALKYYAPSFKYIDRIDLYGTPESKINQLKQYMAPNTSLIVHIKNAQHNRGHYILLKSIEGTTMTVYDPAGGRINTYNAKDLDRVVIYKY